MKQLFAVLLCLLLCGCAQQTAATEPAVFSDVQTKEETAGMYDPNHPIEASYPGEVRAYPLTLRKVQGIRTLGNDVLAFSGYGSTTLTLLTGEELQESASIPLDFELTQDDPSLQIHSGAISFFNPGKQETLVLDDSLQELRRITAPEDLMGSPILSPDQNTLYYCTSRAIMAWNLETGIRRTVKELAYENQALTGLHLNGTVLQCRIENEDGANSLLLSADTGMELGSLPVETSLSSKDTRYFAAVPAGNQQLLIFGETGMDPLALYPEEYPTQQFYLPEDHAAITVSSQEDRIRLDYYELNTGIRRAELALDALQTPKNIVNSKGHSIYILTYDPAADCDILYRWDVLRQTPDPGNTTDHTQVYHASENPDLEALAQCREYAAAIGEKYGITVRIWEDATAVQPWDYEFEAEHLAPVLQKELALLDQRLSRYPEGFLAKTASPFTDLSICLVRQITGTTASDSLNTATGIQFFEDTDAYVVIAVGKFSEQALYHELYHAMETYILNESTALDQWSELNPPGFSYDNGYNPQRDSGIYLQGDSRAFVDTYSMSFPKEDRARILEYAMLPDMAEVFDSSVMQRKLTTLCQGIREAYGLKKTAQVFPWEQYLLKSIAPST